MGNRAMGTILAVVAAIASSAVILAQTTEQVTQARASAVPRTADGTPDLSGVWQRVRREGSRREALPMQPWAEEEYAYNRDPKQPGRGRIELDPRGAHCFPPSVNFLMTYSDPFEIVYAPGRILFLYEYDHWIRHIWMGQEHPKELDLTWMGHSVGKWDGDTLVIDSTGMYAKSWWTNEGHIFTSAMHMVERIRRIDPSTLEFSVTFEDSGAYTRPWTEVRHYESRQDWNLLEKVWCDWRYQKGIFNHE